MDADGRQPHVLVVDDARDTIDLLRDLLEGEGYRVTTSVAVLDLDTVRDLAPDVIVHDLVFGQAPEKGGTFLSLVRRDPGLSRVPVVLCTAAASAVRDPEMADRMAGFGVRIVLKPFDVATLLDELAAALAGQAAPAFDRA